MILLMKTTAFSYGSILIYVYASQVYLSGLVVRGELGGRTSFVNRLHNTYLSYSGLFMIVFARSYVASKNRYYFTRQYPPLNSRQKTIR